MIKNILFGVAGIVVGVVVGIAGFINLNTRYCDACGEKYLNLNKSNICDTCYGYKEAKTDNRIWHNNY